MDLISNAEHDLFFVITLDFNESTTDLHFEDHELF